MNKLYFELFNVKERLVIFLLIYKITRHINQKKFRQGQKQDRDYLYLGNHFFVVVILIFFFENR